MSLSSSTNSLPGPAGRIAAPPLDPPPAIGADIVLRTLEHEGVEVCFGMPGGAILPIYDAIARGTTLRHVLVRHEQAAGHMAQGYARASGRVSAAFATSGPGATNLVTPIADARMDSTPLVCITGQVRSTLIGTDAFQECDIVSVVTPLVKGAWRVTEVGEIASTIRRAVRLARSGRPGPVLVDIPRDVQEDSVLAAFPVVSPSSNAGHSPIAIESDLVRAEALIRAARRPILYVGGGAQGCAVDVRRLAERCCIPVVTTLMGKGAFPESHPLFVGWPGMHGTVAANRALNDSDLIIAAGARFDDRVTGRLDAFASDALVIHIDIDRRELGKIRRPDVAIHAELGSTLARLTAMMADHCPTTALGSWREKLAVVDRRHPLGYGPLASSLKPQAVVQRLAELARDIEDVVWTTGVGQHQMWAMQYIPVDAPRSFVTSGGLGTMGYGLPAAIGVRAARPEATVVCIDGDGSFQMTLQELATAVAADLPVVVVILNNGQLGMVHQWQSMFFEDRLSASDLRTGMPRFADIARGFGCDAWEVATWSGLDAAFTEACASGRPAVLDVLVDPNEDCFPMILPGGAAVDQVTWDAD